MSENPSSFVDHFYNEYTQEEYHHQIRVLLLNSSDAECRFLRDEIVKDKNIKVIGMAKNIHEARRMTRLHDPDIILMDILDPESGGIEFLKRINQFYPRPILLISSISKMPFRLALSAFKEGVADIVNKDDLFPYTKRSYDFLLSKIKISAS